MTIRQLKFRAFYRGEMHYNVFFDDNWVFSEIPDRDGWTGFHAEIEDCAIMQYTGLLDDDGKEIYEGDLINEWSHYEGDRFVEERILEVVFDVGTYLGNVLDTDDYHDVSTMVGFNLIGNKFTRKRT